MKHINGIEVIGDYFVWDGCHKIYILEDDEDLKDVRQKWGQLEFNKDIFSIKAIFNVWVESCPLRFISNWKLTKDYIKQEDNTKNITFKL